MLSQVLSVSLQNSSLLSFVFRCAYHFMQQSYKMGKVSLNTVFNNLKFDEVLAETKLAEDYLKINKGKFRSLFYEPETKISKGDRYGNAIECAVWSDVLLPPPMSPSSSPSPIEPWTIISGRLKTLATKIKENSDLFCQLERLIRRVSFDNTQNSVGLIVKNLLHASADWKAAYIDEGLLTMADYTPFLVLGFIAQIFKACDNPIILSTPDTAVVSYLFTELCHESGWKVQLLLVDQLDNLQGTDIDHIYPNLFNGFLPEVTGIVTDRSDLDSAVDIFLNAGPYPFPLTRIVVQESIFEDFRNTLNWKCNLRNNDKDGDIQELHSKCTDVFMYGNKTFLVNYAGNNTRHELRDVVLVEAFRTAKELLSLLSKYNQLCLSIWASNISDANEVALNVDAPIIWINDFCNFTGSDEITSSIYKRIDSVKMTIKVNSSINNMIKAQEQWRNKTFTERCDAVLGVIKSKDLSLGDKIEPEITNWKINNFIHIEKSCMVLGFNIPDKVVLYNTFATVAVPSPGFDNIVRALVNGSGVVIASKPKNEEEIFITFEAEGIPVTFLDKKEDNGKEVQIPLGDSWCFQTKVVWTNFGTTFAN